MHTSVSYSQLSVEEPTSERIPSVQLGLNGFKRVLLFFAVLCVTTITFIYSRHSMGNVRAYFVTWESSFSNVTDSAEIDNKEDVNLDESPFSKETSKPSWTWTCENTPNYPRCVRVMAPENSARQSAKTCKMTCTEIPIWPLPTGESSFSKTVLPIEIRSFSLNIKKSPSYEVTKYLQEAFAYMKRDIHDVPPMKHDAHAMHMHIIKDAKGLEIRVRVESDADPRLRLDTDESYSLEMKLEEDYVVVNITAKSFCGARHGFETLSQLVWYDRDVDSVLALDYASVKDEPMFRYRGLLLDTARHYFPVEHILRTLDAMAASKLNTFHWHATDAQSFPLKLNSVPQMALHGAYNLKKVYTVDDINTIVHRARLRGIRVVIEVDAPAHVGEAWSWGQAAGLGELAHCVSNDEHEYCSDLPTSGQLDTKNENVYTILQKIYKEIIELTGVDDVFHIGGDEADLQQFQEFNPYEEWYRFEQKSLNALKNANKGKLPEMVLIWSSKLTDGYKLNSMQNFTIQVWFDSRNSDGMQRISDAGLRMVISNVDVWYLDCGLVPFCENYSKWYEVYRHRPWKNNEAWMVEGATACMWTELLAPEGVDTRLWPRGAAFGERLWSDPPKSNKPDLHVRMDMHRTRLVERGVRAEPIWAKWCSDTDNCDGWA